MVSQHGLGAFEILDRMILDAIDTQVPLSPLPACTHLACQLPSISSYVNSSYHPRRCCLLYMSTCPGAIAGIGVGAVAGVGLVAAAAYFVSKVLRHTQ